MRRGLRDLKQSRQHFTCFSQDYLAEGIRVGGVFRTDVDGTHFSSPGAIALVGPVNEVSGGVNHSRSADDEQHRAAINLALDAVHLQRNLAEPDNVRTSARAASATRDGGERFILAQV